MILTIEVSPELETKLETEARNNGIGKDELAKNMLEEKLINGAKKRLPDKSRIIATNLPIKDRSRENAWLEKNCDEYDGQYVALAGDELIARGTDYKEVAMKARELGCKDAIVTLVEGRNRPLFISGGLW